jgi:hypothetical protein
MASKDPISANQKITDDLLSVVSAFWVLAKSHGVHLLHENKKLLIGVFVVLLIAQFIFIVCAIRMAAILWP